jgi:hypothetical protein
MKWIKENGFITSKQYEFLSTPPISDKTAQKDLSDLENKGMIKRSGKARNTRYELVANFHWFWARYTHQYNKTDRENEYPGGRNAPGTVLWQLFEFVSQRFFGWRVEYFYHLNIFPCLGTNPNGAQSGSHHQGNEHLAIRIGITSTSNLDTPSTCLTCYNCFSRYLFPCPKVLQC